jgi:hypothetical protein
MTKSSESELAERIDILVADGPTILVETTTDVVLSGLTGVNAKRLCEETLSLGWDFTLEDSSESECSIAQIGEDLEPYRLRINKPVPDAGVRYLTNAGFNAWLKEATAIGKAEVSRLSRLSYTKGFAVAPWGVTAIHVPEAALKSPRALVRESTSRRVAPADIRPWLLTETSMILWDDEVFRLWAQHATTSLAHSLASEIDPDGALVFGGSPRIKLDAPTMRLAGTWNDDSFAALQAAGRWVFENDRETETRHKLLAIEIARSSPVRREAAMLAECAQQVLEGARLAFQLGLEDISRDTLKALADLRKSLGDEAAKLADSTRQLAASVAAAIFIGLALFAAKIGTTAPKILIEALAFVVTGYVAVVILTNIQFVLLQRSIREEWRGRLYRFLSTSDYESMVLKPARRAELSTFVATWIGGVLALVMLISILFAPESPKLPAIPSVGQGSTATPKLPGGIPK